MRTKDLRRIFLKKLSRYLVLRLRLVSHEFYYLITEKSNHFWAQCYFDRLPLQENP